VALSYGLGVLVSMVVALTVTPALGLVLFSRPPRSPRSSPLVRWLSRGYEAGLARLIRTPRPALFTVGALVVVGLALLPLLGQSLRPAFRDRGLLVHWNAAPSTSLPEMDRITARASAELRA